MCYGPNHRGIQNIWVVDPVEEKGVHREEVLKKGKQYATVKARLKAEKREVNEAAMWAQLEPASGGRGQAGGSSEIKYIKTAMSTRIAKESEQWLTVRRFPDTPSCIAALQAEGYTLWVTHLSQAAVPLDDPSLQPPPVSTKGKLAVVFGREADGVSEAMVAAADRASPQTISPSPVAFYENERIQAMMSPTVSIQTEVLIKRLSSRY